MYDPIIKKIESLNLDELDYVKLSYLSNKVRQRNIFGDWWAEIRFIVNESAKFNLKYHCESPDRVFESTYGTFNIPASPAGFTISIDKLNAEHPRYYDIPDTSFSEEFRQKVTQFIESLPFEDDFSNLYKAWNIDQ